MPRISNVFNLHRSQSELDFVDVDLALDTPLFLDPYALGIRGDDWSVKCTDQIRSFFSEVLGALRAENRAHATHLLSNLHEPNETRLGVSAGRPRGRAIGDEKAAALASAMRRSRAFITGVLSDVGEAELFVDQIGRDTISDLATNVIRNLLSEYTLDQCQIHGIPTQNVANLGPCWNSETRNWQARVHQLPVVDGLAVLMIPKFSVRRSLTLDSQEFYNFHMVEFLQSEYLQAGGALVEVLKNGDHRVTKKSVKEVHPKIKDDLAQFVIDHPEILEAYKALKGAEGPLENDDMARSLGEEYFDEAAFARVLLRRLAAIDTGNDAATEYHSIATGICTFLFYPSLTCPVKEREIHGGRKRIDIKYTNSATSGFFFRMLESAQTRSIEVPIECKNYSKEVANPELDQLTGRFSRHRGRFGILLCRSVDNRARLTERCKDSVNDDRGYPLVFDDADLRDMLTLVAESQRSEVNTFLQRRFDELVA